MIIFYTIAALICTACAIFSAVKVDDASASVTFTTFATIFISLAISKRNKSKREKLS